MDASLCGVLRAFFGDFLSLLSGIKISVPLATTVSTDLADMIILLLGLGCRAHRAPAPLPVRETGAARARAAGAEGERGGRGGGGIPGRAQAGSWCGESLGFGANRGEGGGTRSGRYGIFRDF